MPKYCYYCESCKSGLEIVHSIKDRKKKCDLCGAFALRIIPSIPNYISNLNKSDSQRSTGRETGALVEEYIEKNRESVRKEKERLSKKEIKS